MEKPSISKQIFKVFYVNFNIFIYQSSTLIDSGFKRF